MEPEEEPNAAAAREVCEEVGSHFLFSTLITIICLYLFRILTYIGSYIYLLCIVNDF